MLDIDLSIVQASTVKSPEIDKFLHAFDQCRHQESSPLVAAGQALVEHTSAHSSLLWSFVPSRSAFLLSACVNLSQSEIKIHRMDLDRCASIQAFESGRIARVNCNKANFQHPHLASGYEWNTMVSIPILDSANVNQTLHVINLFFKREPDVTDDVLQEISEFIGKFLQKSLDEECRIHSNQLQHALSVLPTTEDMADEFASQVAKTVQANAVGIYLIEYSEAKLRSYFGERLLAKHYDVASSLVVEATTRNREQYTWDEEAGVAVLAVPMRDWQGQPQGAALCLSELQADDLPYRFDARDATILESLATAFVPYWRILLEQNRQEQGLVSLAHEIRHPITGINAQLDWLARVKDSDSRRPMFISDIKAYIKLFNHLAIEFETAALKSDEILLNIEETSVVKDIMAPVMKSVELLARERNLPTSNIRRPGLNAAPPIWVDQSGFTQVVFNLLSNAIKYSKSDPKLFSISVTYRQDFRKKRIEIVFRDSGVGVPSNQDQLIFERGFRADNVKSTEILGRGLGLSTSKKIMEAHGGGIYYRPNPTGSEFVVFFPNSVLKKKK